MPHSSMIYDKNNIFAKMLRHEMEAIKIYEDSEHLVIMDIMPQSRGHCLVIPNIEASNIFEIEPLYLQKTILLVQKISKAAVNAFEASGIAIAQYNGAAAGQTIFHLHFHVIPHYDNQKLEEHAKKMADPNLLKQQAKLLQKHLML